MKSGRGVPNQDLHVAAESHIQYDDSAFHTQHEDSHHPAISDGMNHLSLDYEDSEQPTMQDDAFEDLA